MAPWIVSHFPKHTTYVEPFGGAASVLMRKERSAVEIYNDLDGEIVNLFRVLRDRSQGKELIRLLALTPFARDEFDESYTPAEDPIEQARRTVVRAFMGYHSLRNNNSGFRLGQNNGKEYFPPKTWTKIPKSMEFTIERLQGVLIENKPAADLIQAHDHPDTLFYIDPPYLGSTRNYPESGYKYEMRDEDDHIELAEVLKSHQGMVIISSYPNDLYARHYGDWKYFDKITRNRGKQRVERLYISPNAILKLSDLPLFEGIAG